MTEFTPYTALLGGLLIGLAASLLLWLNGRIAGISSVLGRLLLWRTGDRTWRALFLLGLLLGAGAWAALGATPPAPRSGVPLPLLLAAGLLTGYGTALANGCTSGHGVCGLARLSLRSLVATATFLGVAIVTTYVARHLGGLPV
jgi:uncharacterized membrane protein YedE/YeeE